MLGLLSLCLAQVVVDVGPEVQHERAGTFHRVFPRDAGGWWMVLGSSGGVAIAMNEDFTLTNEFTDLTDAPYHLNDIGVVECPDGFLAVGSASVEEDDDTAYAWRYDRSWGLLATSTISEGRPATRYNDITLVCGEWLVGVGVNADEGQRKFLGLDSELSVDWEKPLEGAPNMTGSSFMEIDGTLWAVGYRNYMSGKPPLFARYTAGLLLEEREDIEVGPEGEVGWWAQGLVKVPHGWLMANMSRVKEEEWFADEGNVWLHVLDDDFAVLESVQITHFEGPRGCMRPWLTLRDETLIVSYDAEVRPRMKVVTLDLDAMVPELDSADTGEPVDTDRDTQQPDPDSQQPPTGQPTETGRCATTPAPVMAWLVALVGLARRREGGRRVDRD